MKRAGLVFFIGAVVWLLLGGLGTARAQCPALPYTLTNGQTADATQVMADFNALLTCLDTGQFVEAPGPNEQFTGPGGPGDAALTGPAIAAGVPEGMGVAMVASISGGPGALLPGVGSAIARWIAAPGGGPRIAPYASSPEGVAR